MNLRKILIDINSPTVQHAQRNIVTLSQVTESALLDQFEAIFTVLLKSKDDENLELYAEVRELAICLQSFNKGSSLEKRYLFSVVQRALTKNAARLSPSNEGFQLYSTGSVDIGAHRLSDLFRFLTAICDEQFQLIAKVFTQDVGIQMMKLLVQRVFNDPAFGIQVYMDSTLHPRTPHAVLSVEDYLRTLANIKRKLDSFYQGLVDACTYFSVIVNQVKHDSLHMRDIVDKQLSIGNGIASSPTDSVVSPRNDLGGSEMSPKNEVNKEGSNPSDNLRTFLQEQLNQVFGSYLSDYFQKEQVNLKFQYSNCLSKALHDANLFDKKTDSNTTVLSALPIFKAEKMKSIQNLAKSVGNHDFLNNVHSKVVEAVQRMSLIAKSDKKLSIRIKDTYLMHLKFMIECLLIPMMTAAETMLLKHASTSASASALPPPEFLSLLGATLTSIDKAKEHFATTFIPHFIEVPNLLLVCHEAGKAAVRELEVSVVMLISVIIFYVYIMC